MNRYDEENKYSRDEDFEQDDNQDDEVSEEESQEQSQEQSNSFGQIKDAIRSLQDGKIPKMKENAKKAKKAGKTAKRAGKAAKKAGKVAGKAGKKVLMILLRHPLVTLILIILIIIILAVLSFFGYGDTQNSTMNGLSENRHKFRPLPGDKLKAYTELIDIMPAKLDNVMEEVSYCYAKLEDSINNKDKELIKYYRDKVKYNEGLLTDMRNMYGVKIDQYDEKDKTEMGLVTPYDRLLNFLDMERKSYAYFYPTYKIGEGSGDRYIIDLYNKYAMDELKTQNSDKISGSIMVKDINGEKVDRIFYVSNPDKEKLLNMLKTESSKEYKMLFKEYFPQISDRYIESISEQKIKDMLYERINRIYLKNCNLYKYKLVIIKLIDQHYLSEYNEYFLRDDKNKLIPQIYYESNKGEVYAFRNRSKLGLDEVKKETVVMDYEKDCDKMDPDGEELTFDLEEIKKLRIDGPNSVSGYSVEGSSDNKYNASSIKVETEYYDLGEFEYFHRIPMQFIERCVANVAMEKSDFAEEEEKNAEDNDKDEDEIDEEEEIERKQVVVGAKEVTDILNVSVPYFEYVQYKGYEKYNPFIPAQRFDSGNYKFGNEKAPSGYHTEFLDQIRNKILNFKYDLNKFKDLDKVLDEIDKEEERQIEKRYDDRGYTKYQEISDSIKDAKELKDIARITEFYKEMNGFAKGVMPAGSGFLCGLNHKVIDLGNEWEKHYVSFNLYDSENNTDFQPRESVIENLSVLRSKEYNKRQYYIKEEDWEEKLDNAGNGDIEGNNGDGSWHLVNKKVVDANEQKIKGYNLKTNFEEGYERDKEINIEENLVSGKNKLYLKRNFENIYPRMKIVKCRNLFRTTQFNYTDNPISILRMDAGITNMDKSYRVNVYKKMEYVYEKTEEYEETDEKGMSKTFKRTKRKSKYGSKVLVYVDYYNIIEKEWLSNPIIKDKILSVIDTKNVIEE